MTTEIVVETNIFQSLKGELTRYPPAIVQKKGNLLLSCNCKRKICYTLAKDMFHFVKHVTLLQLDKNTLEADGNLVVFSHVTNSCQNEYVL